jgi:hypothetical protein
VGNLKGEIEMTRQLKRYEERMQAKASSRTLGPAADPDKTAGRYCQKLTRLPLPRLQRELSRTYQEARQMDRVLAAYRLENEGSLPLITAPEAPVALAIGNKFYYIARELHSRGVTPLNDVILGGKTFAEFFEGVAARAEQSDKDTVSNSFLSQFAGKIRTLLRGRK